jgi:hypothetical protein
MALSVKELLLSISGLTTSEFDCGVAEVRQRNFSQGLNQEVKHLTQNITRLQIHTTPLFDRHHQRRRRDLTSEEQFQKPQIPLNHDPKTTHNLFLFTIFTLSIHLLHHLTSLEFSTVHPYWLWPLSIMTVLRS